MNFVMQEYSRISMMPIEDKHGFFKNIVAKTVQADYTNINNVIQLIKTGLTSEATISKMMKDVTQLARSRSLITFNKTIQEIEQNLFFDKTITGRDVMVIKISIAVLKYSLNLWSFVLRN